MNDPKYFFFQPYSLLKNDFSYIELDLLYIDKKISWYYIGINILAALADNNSQPMYRYGSSGMEVIKT